jgi:uncharacterized protein YegP (UPF0339 family)
MIAILPESGNGFRFSLKAASGRSIFNSVLFDTKEQLKEVLMKMKHTLETDFKIERKTDHNGKFLFILKNKDNMEIGNSNLYDSEAGMQNGIKNMKISLHEANDLTDL